MNQPPCITGNKICTN